LPDRVWTTACSCPSVRRSAIASPWMCESAVVVKIVVVRPSPTYPPATWNM
jgi:hypothetical protein